MKYNFFKKHIKIIFIFFAAAVIPLISLAMMLFSNDTNIFSYLSYSLIFIFLINPIMIVLSFCFIKKYPKFSQITLATTSINVLFWIILLFPAANIHALHQTEIEQKFLQSYGPIIENIYKYKQENKKFPDRIEQIKSKYKTNSHLIYTKTNQDFILQLNKDTQTIYFYCSNKQAPECNSKDNRFVTHKNVGQWVKLQEID